MARTHLVIDACGLLNLLATGHEIEIVEALDWHLMIPAMVLDEEVKYLRTPPDKKGLRRQVPVDLGPLRKSGRLKARERDNDWLDDFVACAELLADKDAACAALAGFSGLPLVTDDPKVKSVTRERYAAVRLISTLEFVVEAVGKLGMDEGETAYNLRWRGNFLPPRGDANAGWFEAALRRRDR